MSNWTADAKWVPSQAATAEKIVADAGADKDAQSPDPRYVSVPMASITRAVELDRLRHEPFSRTVLAPAGTMEMPVRVILNGNPGLSGWDRADDGEPLRHMTFPPMWLARLDDVQYWPFAPPFLPAAMKIIDDFLVPWGPASVGWFTYEGEGVYRFPHKLFDVPSIDIAFYMGHSISGHFGHFIGDCLSRMHAWRTCRDLFGNIPIVLEHSDEDTGFREQLLLAAGAREQDLIFIKEPVHCRSLLLASPALGVERYASPTSAALWRSIRDTFDAGPADYGDKVYLSRSGQPLRKLKNEAEVEKLFEGFGFRIVRPENLSPDQQIALIANARLIAGPGGSAMFNLAFQRRLKSVLLIVPEFFMQITEWLLLAGTNCPVNYHIGTRDPAAAGPVNFKDAWQVDLAQLGLDVARWLAADA